ncbi:hypothetical protein MANES_17G096900v8 [Manihot esculenta]|uniref:Uncharacterized protein n=1 Tax=Manihot esculenta TaxID=3983 RepID=A0ACB7G824_MANES|nr:hypothetical protein MANES_17G096900v8 [Manihot esculenta]
MSAVVEIWVTELAKLKEKVRQRKPLISLSKAKGAVVAEEDKEAGKESKVFKRETNISESTVFMLMDRFAPS